MAATPVILQDAQQQEAPAPETSVPEIALQDMQAQKQGFTMQDVIDGNVSEVGDIFVTSEMRENLKTDDELYGNIMSAVEQFGTPPQDMGETIKPFVRGDKIVIPPSITNPQDIDEATTLAERKQSVDVLIRNAVPNPVVRQVIVNKMLPGTFLDDVKSRAGDVARGMASLPALGWLYSSNAIDAYQASDGTWDGFTDALSARTPEINKGLNTYYDALETVGLEGTLGRSMDNIVREELQKQVDSGELSQEAFDETVYETVNGERVNRTLIDETSAQNLMELNRDSLGWIQQLGSVLFEQVITGGAVGMGKSAKSARELDRVLAFKTDPKYAAALENVDDPLQIARIVKAENNKVKINDNFLLLGIREAKVDATVNRLKTDKEALGKELDSMYLAGVDVNSSAYLVKQQELERADSLMTRALFTGKTIPLVSESVGNLAIVGAGQYAARELLPMAFDIEPSSAEAFGALFMALGGVNVVKATGRVTGKVAVSVIEVVPGSIGDTFQSTLDYITFNKGIFKDRTIDDYERMAGVTLSAKQRKAIRYTSGLMQGMTEEARNTVLSAADQYIDLRDRIVSKFPNEKQEDARRLFTLSFAQAGAISPLMAMNRVATAKLDTRNLAKMNFEETAQNQRMLESQSTITEEALANFQKMVDDTPDMVGREEVQAMLDNAKKAVSKTQQNLNEANEKHLAALDNLETTVFDDISTQIPDDFFTQLHLTRKELHGRLGKAFDEKAEILRLQYAMEEGLNNRMAVIEGMRGKGKAHQVALANATEDFMDTHLASIYAQGRAAYSKVDEFSKGRPSLDMTPAVEGLVESMGDTDIMTLFSPGGTFFAGKLGKQAQSVFQGMVERTFSTEDLSEMRSVLAANGYEGLTDIEVALRAQNASEFMSVFSQAKPYEVEVMRRTFRDYSRKLAQRGKKDLSSEYTKFAGELETVLKQDKEMYEMLTQARITYRSEVGDRLRKDSIVKKVDMSREGGEKVAKNKDEMFRFRYSGSVDPVSAFKKVGDTINKVGKGGTGAAEARHDLPKLIQNIATDFGERIDGEVVFDLTTPAGKTKFEGLQRVVQEHVYSGWAEGVIENMKVPTPASGPMAGRLAERVGGYNFATKAGWNEMSDLTMVTVKTAEKGVHQVPLADLEMIVSNQKSIDSLIANNAVVKKRYNEWSAEISNSKSEISRSIQTEINKQLSKLDDFKSITGDTTPAQFYDTYVLNGNPTKIDALRKSSTEAMSSSLNISLSEAEEVFDAATKSLVARGLQERGALVPIKGQTIRSVNEKAKVSRVLATPEQMVLDISENREVLEKFLEPEHIEYMEDLTDFLNRASDSGNAPAAAGAGMYSMTEGLSRLYNISRGMVSPLYVTSEFAVRLASAANVEIMQLAFQNEEAAKIMLNMFKYPELVTKVDVTAMDRYLNEFVLTELTKKGANISAMIASEETTKEQTDENEQ